MYYYSGNYKQALDDAAKAYNESDQLGLMFVILEGDHQFVQEAIYKHVEDNEYELVASGACSVDKGLLHWAHLKISAR